jgi:predicted lipoprotein with Yx(FWY)xxD motif
MNTDKERTVMKAHDTWSGRRTLGVLCAATAALALSACASEEPAASSSGGGSSDGPVQTRDVAGVGTVLADTSGNTLYFTDSESDGSFKCQDDCLSLWIPAAAPGDTVDGAPVPDLGVVQRPDGMKQLAYQNKPLYTFTMDSTDKPASGHNATDSFGGEEFTWRAVVVAGGGQQQPKDDGYGPGYGGGGGY